MDNIALGLSVPPCTPHAISVSLPTWRDNVGYEEGEKRVVDRMVSGYPRFFIHLKIKEVCVIHYSKCHKSSLSFLACRTLRTKICSRERTLHAFPHTADRGAVPIFYPASFTAGQSTSVRTPGAPVHLPRG